MKKHSAAFLATLLRKWITIALSILLFTFSSITYAKGNRSFVTDVFGSGDLDALHFNKSSGVLTICLVKKGECNSLQTSATDIAVGHEVRGVPSTIFLFAERGAHLSCRFSTGGESLDCARANSSHFANYRPAALRGGTERGFLRFPSRGGSQSCADFADGKIRCSNVSEVTDEADASLAGRFTGEHEHELVFTTGNWQLCVVGGFKTKCKLISGVPESLRSGHVFAANILPTGRSAIIAVTRAKTTVCGLQANADSSIGLICEDEYSGVDTKANRIFVVPRRNERLRESVQIFPRYFSATRPVYGKRSTKIVDVPHGSVDDAAKNSELMAKADLTSALARIGSILAHKLEPIVPELTSVGKVANVPRLNTSGEYSEDPGSGEDDLPAFYSFESDAGWNFETWTDIWGLFFVAWAPLPGETVPECIQRCVMRFNAEKENCLHNAASIAAIGSGGSALAAIYVGRRFGWRGGITTFTTGAALAVSIAQGFQYICESNALDERDDCAVDCIT